MSRAAVATLLALAAALTLAAANTSCRDEGDVLYSARYLHKLDETKARIQAPAPAWSAKAVIKGEIKDISLADFLGKCRSRAGCWRCMGATPLSCSGSRRALTRMPPGPVALARPYNRRRRRVLLLPPGFHLCVPHGDSRIQRSGGRVCRPQHRRDWRLCGLRVHPRCLVGPGALPAESRGRLLV